MAPRPYRLGHRKASVDETRARIVAGARDLLMSDHGFTHFTMDAIARESGVARMTVYYQFQSKTGIYEALADDLAARGEIAKNVEASFREKDPRDGLVKLVGAFVHFWLSNPDVMRKLHALSTLDPDSRTEERNARRREAIETMLARLQKSYKLPTRSQMRRSVEALHMLMGFSATDLLAQAGYREREIVKALCDLVSAAVGLDLTN